MHMRDRYVSEKLSADNARLPAEVERLNALVAVANGPSSGSAALFSGELLISLDGIVVIMKF